MIKQQQQQQHQHQDQDKQAALKLQHLSQLCDQLEYSALTVESFNEQWRQSDLPAKHWLHDIEQRKAHLVTSKSQADASTTLQFSAKRQEKLTLQRQQLCAQVEILTGLDSPESAANIRMQLQVERLRRGLLRGAQEDRDTETQMKDLQVAWYSLGHLEIADEALRDRFAKAEQTLGF